MLNRSTFEYLLNAGRTPSQTSIDELRHIHVVTIISFILICISILMLLFHGFFGVKWLMYDAGVGLILLTLNLAALYKSDNIALHSHIMVGIFFVCSLVGNMIYGGYHDPNYLWLMLLPVLAAFAISFRAMWIYVGILMAFTAIIIYVEHIDVLPLIKDKTQNHNIMTAINRFGLIILLGLAVQMFYRERTRYKKKIEETSRRIRVASHQRDELFANITHELKTPLTGMMGMSELLLKTNLTNDQKYYARTMHESGETLLSLINDMLDYTKMESDHFALHEEPFDLRASVESTVNLLAKEAYDKQLDLTYYAPPDLPGSMIGDGFRYKQILRNLLSNAVKFTEKGEVSVRVTYKMLDAEKILITTHVEDSGIGISKANREKIFQSFTQADDSIQQTFGGTGLGLAITKRLTHLMQGEINLTSTIGKGSDFSFTCIFKVDCQSKDSNDIPFLNEPHTALCIGLSETDRELIEASLETWNIRCSSTDSSIIGLNLLKDKIEHKHPIDFVVIDHDTNNQDNAFEIFNILSQQDYKTHVIELHKQTKAPQFSSKKFGVIHHLQKPIRGSALYEIILNACSESFSSKLKSTAHNIPIKLSGNILVAEDNVINQALIKVQLNLMGVHYDIVSNGIEVLENLNDKHYDLVVMDCHMPRMDGMSCTQKIRESQEAYKDIPIIALTADAQPDERQDCMQCGMNDFISKPFKQRDFIATLSKWLLKQGKSDE